jgi:hypothetical protein
MGPNTAWQRARRRRFCNGLFSGRFSGRFSGAAGRHRQQQQANNAGPNQRNAAPGFNRRHVAGRLFGQARRNGIDRKRCPLAAKIALPTAGKIGGVPGSPAPPIASPLLMIATSIAGASSIRTTL